ncbi:hypothetical protein COX24_02150 [bacterium (Candidatus Gribaldobacteria) CG23_combo_of_CG06-09_8_20_14_all_37_87_8]|uniref:AI-2E family transporter n=2 Tax=Candidatus Gribaldobacteria TaxID=2798536 RepID=A0A2G9ZH88_9BACT|nr:MAG: hypothetical protein COX24_02150 [bacterium (Candidatus Gribaldobacteria) CG23_combo_of_CG06-09_8_20_14_all_37_87_8]PIR90003.1 MAG: hypothetical protein COU05_03450 [bacterium (Candidatus Gribaldobacteria) CG10_big_fil_rev_8_21_14_0_10_37_21]
MQKQGILDISWATVFKIFAVVIIGYVLYMVKDILVWLAFAVMIGILFNFIIDPLEKKKIPRIVSALFLYLAVFALIGFFIYKTAPIFVSEIKDFAENFPLYLSKISPVFEKLGVQSFRSTDALIEALQSSVEPAGNSFLGALFSIFGGASATILVVILAFFISVEKRFVAKTLEALSPAHKQDYVLKIWLKAKKKVSGWFITRIVGVLFVAASTFLVLRILNVKYALLLAIIAGVLDFMPIVGPLVAGVMLGMVVGINSLLQAGFVLLAFVIIQQLENNLIFPILFKKFLDISPVLVLIALAIGGRLWGVSGAILAIPLAAVLYEIIKDYLKKTKEQQNELVEKVLN